MLKIEYVTDIGRSRSQNEDSIFADKNEMGHYILIVADGMGGHNAGEVASKMACDIVSKEFKKIKNEVNYKKFLRYAIRLANQEIYKSSIINSEHSKMGTTISVVIYDYKKIYTAHVGDSRIYFIDNQQILQITKDHTLVQAMLDAGNLNEFEAKTSKFKNVILQALGTSKKLTIEIKEVALPKKFIILLCSDGLTGPIEDQYIQQEMIKEQKLKTSLENLVSSANEQDGGDNVSIIVMERWKR